MERKKKVRIGPNPEDEIEVTELGFRSSGENWNEYLIDDGSVVRLKMVVTDVARADGEYDPQGNPIYLVQSTNVMSVSAPDDLRKKGE